MRNEFCVGFESINDRNRVKCRSKRLRKRQSGNERVENKKKSKTSRRRGSLDVKGERRGRKEVKVWQNAIFRRIQKCL